MGTIQQGRERPISSLSHSTAATTPLWPAFTYSQQLLPRMMPPVIQSSRPSCIWFPHSLPSKRLADSNRLGWHGYGWPTNYLSGQTPSSRPRGTSPSNWQSASPSSDILWCIGKGESSTRVQNARKPLQKKMQTLSPQLLNLKRERVVLVTNVYSQTIIMGVEKYYHKA